MSSIHSPSYRRIAFGDSREVAQKAARNAATNAAQGTAHAPSLERRLLELLLAQDGSTTRLCEAIAGEPIQVDVLSQQTVRLVPDVVRTQLPGDEFIERITSLVARGEVLMDNLSYIAMHRLEPDVEAALREGSVPIGHLLSRWWVRRVALDDDGGLPQRLWQVVGLPDAPATRTYRIDTPQSPRMLIAETFRRGMLMDCRAKPHIEHDQGGRIV